MTFQIACVLASCSGGSPAAGSHDASDSGQAGADAKVDASTDVASPATDTALGDGGGDVFSDGGGDDGIDSPVDILPDVGADTLADVSPDALADATPPADVGLPDVPSMEDTQDVQVDAPPLPDVDAAADVNPFAGLVKSYNTSCKLTGEPTAPPLLTTEPVLTGATMVKPVQMVTANDGTGRVFFVSQPGRILVAVAITKDGTVSQWLDLQAKVEDGPNEAGLLSMAFHPDFVSNGWFYVDYTRSQGGQLQSVVSRFTVPNPPLGVPDPASEQVILFVDQPYANHNGGQVAFGSDGMLYVGLGDGGSGGDPQGNGQNAGTLLGAILRIDVEAPAAGYAIPADNPFVDTPGKRGEIWAYGLRNPWRFGFDPVDGTLWAGDVGQNAIEEVDIIEKGGNYGWNIMEGSECYASATCDTTGLVLPVAEYDHSLGKSVTGGHVYHGTAMPALQGTYLFADYAFGTVWGLAKGQSGELEMTELGSTGVLVSAFGYGPDGESYVLDWGGGHVHRLVAEDPTAAGEPGWPGTLSETGCFADVPSLTLADGILSYSVNAPLWSDGAAKERALVLPPDGQMGFTETGAWELPEGTILIKTFSLFGKRLETRFLVKSGGELHGATYRWNAAQTEATLLDGALTEDVGGQTWTYPSRGDCRGCHTKAAGETLGLRTPQMNRVHDMFATGAGVPQIGALSYVGYFDKSVSAPDAELPAFPEPGDETADLGSRARAYLHANCSHCHMPGGLATATIDLRYWTTLPDTGACGVGAQQGDLGVPGAKILAPGDSGKSTLWLRMATTDPSSRMPPVASSVPDPLGVELIGAWIDGLGGCTE